ncbi:glycosyltransferase family 9 protein [Myxococcota bacterium]|nr:glycosyltransferase family 9 protein [Myxococcota bacterium]
MNKETIRRLDRLLGNVVCLLLTAHRRVADALLRRTPPPPGSVRRILFLKLVEQGATVLAAPAIDRAIARVGRENVYFCVFRENRPIVDLLGQVPAGNVIEVRHDGLAVFLMDVARALLRVRHEGIDAVVDMEFMARAPAILAYLTGAPTRIGLHRFADEGPYRGDLLTHRVQHNPYLHVSRAYSLLVEALDADPRDLPLLKVPVPDAPDEAPRLAPTAEDVARVRGLLDGAGGDRPGPLVLLNPNTGDLLPLRRWPDERFVELGRRVLAGHPDATVVVTGAPSEREGAEEVCRRIGSPRAVSLAGRTTLRDAVVLYSLADVLVTNDSGPGHFASLTGVDNIVLFGPETPARFGPLGEGGRPLWARLACSPCVNAYNHRFSPCVDNRCMAAITVDEVYREVASCLRARRERLGAARRSAG